MASLLSHLDRVTLSCGLLAQLERRVGWALTIDRVDVAEQGEGGHAGGDRVDQAELGLLHQVLIREIDGHRVQLVERAAGQRADGLGRLQQALGGDGCAERQQRQREREHGCETAGPQPFWFFVVRWRLLFCLRHPPKMRQGARGILYQQVAQASNDCREILDGRQGCDLV